MRNLFKAILILILVLVPSASFSVEKSDGPRPAATHPAYPILHDLKTALSDYTARGIQNLEHGEELRALEARIRAELSEQDIIYILSFTNTPEYTQNLEDPTWATFVIRAIMKDSENTLYKIEQNYRGMLYYSIKNLLSLLENTKDLQVQKNILSILSSALDSRAFFESLSENRTRPKTTKQDFLTRVIETLSALIWKSLRRPADPEGAVYLSNVIDTFAHIGRQLDIQHPDLKKAHAFFLSTILSELYAIRRNTSFPENICNRASEWIKILQPIQCGLLLQPSDSLTAPRDPHS